MKIPYYIPVSIIVSLLFFPVLPQTTPQSDQAKSAASGQAASQKLDAGKLMSQAQELYKSNQLSEALLLAQQALEISEQQFGKVHPNLIGILGFLGEVNHVAGNYEQAYKSYSRVLFIQQAQLKRAVGATARELTLAIASTHYNMGLASFRNYFKDYSRNATSEPMGDKFGQSFENALMIWETHLAANHPYLTNVLDKLAEIAEQNKTLNEALYLRLLENQERTLGKDHVNIAKLLAVLGYIDLSRKNYIQAEARFQRALQIYEKIYGPDHIEVARALHSLAALQLSQRNFAEAETKLRQALSLYEQSSPGRLPFYLPSSVYEIGPQHFIKGEYAKAELLYDQALRVFEKYLGPRSSETAKVQLMLAEIYERKGDLEGARELKQLALENKASAIPASERSPVRRANISKEQTAIEHGPGPKKIDAPPSESPINKVEKPPDRQKLHQLALLSLSQEDKAKAEEYFQQELAEFEKDKSSLSAVTLEEHAIDYYNRGEHVKAVQMQSLSVEMMESLLDPSQPAIPLGFRRLAMMKLIKGDIDGAIAAIGRAGEGSERQLARNVVTGSERQKMIYLSLFEAETSEIISFHVEYAPKNATALRLALTTLLRRKGRGLSLVSETMNALRRSDVKQDQLVLDKLMKARAQLASLALGITQTADQDKTQKQLFTQIEQLEAEISARLFEPAERTSAVTLNEVQSLIPPDAALIEFALYTTAAFRINEQPTKRYAAYILTSQGEPQLVDLGQAEPIDSLVVQAREALRDKKSPEVKMRARALDEKVMSPVRKLLRQKRHLLLSPDGALNLIPFAALVDEKNRYLVEQYSFTYLTSGRDLLRLQNHAQGNQGVVVIANPDFGESKVNNQKRETPLVARGFNFSQAYFPPLPGTAEEANALQKLLPQTTVFTQSQATETALKQVARPTILHIATHGFFLEDVDPPPDMRNSRLFLLQQTAAKEPSSPALLRQHPLLRSGLAFAKANVRDSSDDDGILTAYEASTLNLSGTKLVVLSACDTGVGEIKNGEGVYGLRRALVLAGAETQVMSLWPVSDKGTSELMIAYYQALQAGKGRSEGLRQVQLRMLTNPSRQHPYFWASFFVSGEWANLEGKR